MSAARAQPAGGGAGLRRDRLAGVPVPPGIEGARDAQRVPRRDDRSGPDPRVVAPRPGPERGDRHRRAGPGRAGRGRPPRAAAGSPRSTEVKRAGLAERLPRDRPHPVDRDAPVLRRDRSAQRVGPRPASGLPLAGRLRRGAAEPGGWRSVRGREARARDRRHGVVGRDPRPARAAGAPGARTQQAGARARHRATSLDRLVEWTAAREAGDRNFPLFWAAKQAALAGQLDGARGGAVRRRGAAVRAGGRRAGGPAHDRQRRSGRRPA